MPRQIPACQVPIRSFTGKIQAMKRRTVLALIFFAFFFLPLSVGAQSSESAPLSADDWRSFPILPASVSDGIRLRYRFGLADGNVPTRFSKIGDSNSVHTYFLGCFDSKEYDLGAYSGLAATIARYRGSFARASLATRNGLTAADALGTHWDPNGVCSENESAVDCELRLWRPSIVVVALGTNDVYRSLTDFELSLHEIMRKVLNSDAIPILILKADNLNDSGEFNRIIAQAALTYEVPIVNLWRAMDPLPNHGLRGDHAHPSAGSPRFCDFTAQELSAYGWPVRNLVVLSAIARVTELLSEP